MADPSGTRGLVWDASVGINLLATEMLEGIVRALNSHVYLPDKVLAEITRHPITHQPVDPERDLLIGSANPISVVGLQDRELEFFLDLVGAPSPDGLGDGEAAAIAVACIRGLDLVVDDGKARRIIRERFPEITTYWTVDLLRAPSIHKALGPTLADECFTKAHRFGRMHIPRL
jgi:hypothetical protein